MSTIHCCVLLALLSAPPDEPLQGAKGLLDAVPSQMQPQPGDDRFAAGGAQKWLNENAVGQNIVVSGMCDLFGRGLRQTMPARDGRPRYAKQLGITFYERSGT
ncbi:MAG: hypothetical protein ABSG68_11850, partial [Thermoguttaceae bacterium]